MASAVACRSCSRGHAAVAIEGGDHLVPLRDQRGQLPPESLAPAPLEIGERDALLLDPGEVAEVEDARTLALGGVEHVVGAGAEQMRANKLGGERLGHGALVVAAGGGAA